ncbi:glycosyltransferase family 4 protein [Arthrobacter crusticola]|nr:glycosyltransferase family 4 protein [Arthrobacter crusticola]
MPYSMVRRIARAAARLPVRGPGVLPILAAHLLGNTTQVTDLLDAAQENRPGGAQARWMAEIALATGNPEAADGLLESERGRTAEGRTAGTLARRAWYDGDMSGAVRILQEAGDGRYAARLSAELQVFRGWNPAVDPATGYVPRRKTVLHVLTNSLPHTHSGYAQRSHSILKAQQEQGWDVHAVTRVGYPVQVGKILADDVDVVDGVTYHRLLPARLAPGFDGRLQQQAEDLLALALKLRPSVLHTTTHFVNGLVTGEVAGALGIPWVYEVRGQLADTWASSRHERAKSSERYKLFTDREAQVMRNASLVVTLGEAMKQEIMRAGVPEDRILLGPNAVGEEYLAEPVASTEARRQLGLPEDGVFVGTVSSLVEYEGLDHLLRAVALLEPTHPQLRCLIVGDGVARPALESLAVELGISGKVLFTGRVPRARARLHHLALDIFAVPRRDFDVTRSVTPLKPVEAMACARPVIASDLPALREIVTVGTTGILVEPSNPDALAAAISGLLAGGSVDQSAVRMGREGRRTVLEQRTWAGNAAAYQKAYAAVGAGE